MYRELPTRLCLYSYVTWPSCNTNRNSSSQPHWRGNPHNSQSNGQHLYVKKSTWYFFLSMFTWVICDNHETTLSNCLPSWCGWCYMNVFDVWSYHALHVINTSCNDTRHSYVHLESNISTCPQQVENTDHNMSTHFLFSDHMDPCCN